MKQQASSSAPLPVLLVRDALDTDQEALDALRRLSDELVAPQRGGRLELLTHAENESEAALHLVAELNGLVVGALELAMTSFATGEALATVSHLFVHPSARGVGAGRALLRHAVDYAQANSVIGIDARALPGDRATKNFFESFGLVARAISVHASLE